jgi:hypothetical protein
VEEALAVPPEWRAHTAGVVTIELDASLVRESYSHNVRWAKTMEMRLDCFLCERSGRTTWLELGAEAGTCSGSRQGVGPHPAPARVVSFDSAWSDDRRTMRWVIDRWWEQFYDSVDKRDGNIVASALWARIHIDYRCPETSKQAEDFTQSNLAFPYTMECRDCGERLGTWEEPPQIRLLAHRATG